MINFYRNDCRGLGISLTEDKLAATQVKNLVVFRKVCPEVFRNMINSVYPVFSFLYQSAGFKDLEVLRNIICLDIQRFRKVLHRGLLLQERMNDLKTVFISQSL